MSGIDQAIEDIASEFALLPDWEERIAHIMELARGLEPLADGERNEHTRVRGCASQVWLVPEHRPAAPDKLFFRGDSDAQLVRGNVAMLLRIFSGRTPHEILSVTPEHVFDRLGLADALTAQRANGLYSMINRIHQEAQKASR